MSLEIFTNEVEMNNEPLQERYEIFSNPIVFNKTSQIEEGKKKEFLNIYMLKEKYGDPIIKIHYMWLFYCIIDSAKVDNKVPQLMRRHLCYPNPITIANSITQLRK